MGWLFMVTEGRGRIYKRKSQDKYLLYLPKALVEDTMFPFKVASSRLVKVGFKPRDNRLYVENWRENSVTST